MRLGARLARGLGLILLTLVVPTEPSVAATGGSGERSVRLAQALAAADRGDWRTAETAAAAVGLPALRTYMRWRMLAEARADVRPPFAVYASFLQRERDWPSLALVQARAEETIDDAVPMAARLAFFENRKPRSRQGRLRLAEALLAEGHAEAGIDLVRTSWVDDRFSVSEEAMVLARFGASLRPADDEARMDRLLWNGDLAATRRLLPRLSPAVRLLAVARLRLQEDEPGVDAAIAAVPEALRNDPGLQFDRLRWRKRRGDAEGVRAILLDPPAVLGQPARWWDEQQPAMREALDARAFSLAYRLAAASRQPAGTPLADSEWLAGWLALRFLDQPERALDHFERLWRSVSTPISRARAAYWLGRTEAALGRPSQASAWYGRAAAFPQAFYGQLAALEVGLEPRDRLEPATEASATALTALRRRPIAQVAELLCRAGAARAAQPLFRHLGHEAAAEPARLRAVLAMVEACGRPELELAAVRAAAGNGAYLAREAFPLPRARAFHERREGAPEAALLMALARQESLFDPAARSPAGAMGLMQLMPETAAGVARELGLPLKPSQLMADPNLNVRLGALYLQKQLARFDGETALALAAYNAGPRRVDAWLATYGDPRGTDGYRLIDWIELIPFAETRNYVQRVLEGRGMYRAILAGPRSEPARTVAAVPPRPRFKPAT